MKLKKKIDMDEEKIITPINIRVMKIGPMEIFFPKLLSNDIERNQIFYKNYLHAFKQSTKDDSFSITVS
jgi:hypothetical protein